jgi:hypothetical protein
VVQLNEAELGEALMVSGGVGELIIKVTGTLRGELTACASTICTLPVYVPGLRFFATVAFKEIAGLDVGDATVSQAPPVTVTNEAEYAVPLDPTVSVWVVVGTALPNVKPNAVAAVDVRVANTWKLGVTGGAAR